MKKTILFLFALMAMFSALGQTSITTKNGIQGSGTANYIPKFSAAKTLTNSSIYNASNGFVGIGGTSSIWGEKLYVNGAITTEYVGNIIRDLDGSNYWQLYSGNRTFKINDTQRDALTINNGASKLITMNPIYNLGVGTDSPTANTKLTVVGSGSTSATYLLDMRNSAGQNSLQIRDDGLVNWYQGGYSSAQIDLGANWKFFNYTYFHNGVTFGNITQVDNAVVMKDTWLMGLGSYDSGTKLFVNGGSFTDAFTVANSSLTPLFKVKSSGLVSVGNSGGANLLNVYHTLTATSKTTDIDCINLGGHYSSTDGSYLKLKLYDDGGTTSGLGIAGGKMFYQSGSTGIDHSFWAGANKVATIQADGNVSLSNTTAPACAKLDIVSTTGGVLMPRMTTTQKNAISSPLAGLMVYDTTLNQMSYYNGTTWVNF